MPLATNRLEHYRVLGLANKADNSAKTNAQYIREEEPDNTVLPDMQYPTKSFWQRQSWTSLGSLIDGGSPNFQGSLYEKLRLHRQPHELVTRTFRETGQ
jgi:hypothetical protein